MCPSPSITFILLQRLLLLSIVHSSTSDSAASLHLWWRRFPSSQCQTSLHNAQPTGYCFHRWLHRPISHIHCCMAESRGEVLTGPNPSGMLLRVLLLASSVTAGAQQWIYRLPHRHSLQLLKVQRQRTSRIHLLLGRRWPNNTLITGPVFHFSFIDIPSQFPMVQFIA